MLSVIKKNNSKVILEFWKNSRKLPNTGRGIEWKMKEAHLLSVHTHFAAKNHKTKCGISRGPSIPLPAKYLMKETCGHDYFLEITTHFYSTLFKMYEWDAMTSKNWNMYDSWTIAPSNFSGNCDVKYYIGLIGLFLSVTIVCRKNKNNNRPNLNRK